LPFAGHPTLGTSTAPAEATFVAAIGQNERLGSVRNGTRDAMLGLPGHSPRGGPDGSGMVD
jgi:hypothetical protein